MPRSSEGVGGGMGPRNYWGMMSEREEASREASTSGKDSGGDDEGYSGQSCSVKVSQEKQEENEKVEKLVKGLIEKTEKLELEWTALNFQGVRYKSVLGDIPLIFDGRGMGRSVLSLDDAKFDVCGHQGQLLGDAIRSNCKEHAAIARKTVLKGALDTLNARPEPQEG